MTIAIALSGGGAKGDFQVGALRYLYDQGVRPDILCSTSVGSVNAIKLAEGEDWFDGSQGLRGLEASWATLRESGDMFEEEAWLHDPDMLPSVRDVLTGKATEFNGSGPPHTAPVWGDLNGLIHEVENLDWLLDEGAKLLKCLSIIIKARSLYNLNPVLRRMQRELDPSKVAAWAQRGGRLRIGMVGLRSGLLRYATEVGHIIETDGTIAERQKPSSAIDPACRPLAKDLAGLEGTLRELQAVIRQGNKGLVPQAKAVLEQIKAARKKLDACVASHPPPAHQDMPPLVVSFPVAALASASIPGIFLPTSIGDDTYVDAGIREVLPLQAAVDLGADAIYAISASQMHIDPAQENYQDATVMATVSRSLTEIAIHEIALNDLAIHPVPGKSLPTVCHVFPVRDVHNILTIDPGLVQIARDYGYMRAADAFGYVHENSRRAVLATDIMELRRDIWALENRVAGQPDPRLRSGAPQPADSSLQVKADARKAQLQGLLAERSSLDGPLPRGARHWVIRAERHPWLPDEGQRPEPPDRTLFADSGAVHVLYGGARFHVPDPATLARLFPGQAITTTWAGAMRDIPTAPMDGTMLREENGRIWIVAGQAKFLVPDMPTMERLYAARPVCQLWDGAPSQVGDKPIDGTLLRVEDGKVWVVVGGGKFHVPDPATLVRLFGGRPWVNLWTGALDRLPDVPNDGTLLQEEGSDVIYVIRNRMKARSEPLQRGIVHRLWGGALASIPEAGFHAPSDLRPAPAPPGLSP